MTDQSDPYGDFSFEELGGQAVEPPSATGSLPPPAEGEETDVLPEMDVAGTSYKSVGDVGEVEGFTPLGAAFRQEGNGQ